MDLAFTTEPHDHYLKMTVTGHWKLPDIMELIEIIKAAAEQAGNDRVLVDLRGVEGRPKEMDRFYADERAAKVFGFKLKVAVVARAEVINKFAENTAANLGARLTAVSSEQDAIKWLEE